MKNVVIVAPHFPPSNLAAVHRSRLFARHLPKFGWNPTIVSVDPQYYEEPLDRDLESLLPESLEIIRTAALPTRPLRLVGDLGIRTLLHHYRLIRKLASERRVDLLFIPIPPNFSALLGPLIYRRFGIPYAIDYIDPWVHFWPEAGVMFSKAWWALQLGRLAEPVVIQDAALVTGVASAYYDGVRARHRDLPAHRCAAMPYGAEAEDFAALDRLPPRPLLFDPEDGCSHFVYAGAMLPRAYDTLRALFEAVRKIERTNPEEAARIRLHFIGTGSRPTDANSHLVMPIAHELGVAAHVTEHAARIPYLDVLAHLRHATAVLVIGSSEPHYTASKIFQAVLSRRPVLALLHRESSAATILREASAGVVIPFDDGAPVRDRIADIASALLHSSSNGSAASEVDWTRFAQFSAEAVTRQLAAAFDKAIA